jgi:hypothetical protein
MAFHATQNDESHVFYATIRLTFNAGIAQLVERNLAKVEVESSRLFSRSSTFSVHCCGNSSVGRA